MTPRKAFCIAAGMSFAMNWLSIPYALPVMKQAAREATIERLELFAQNLRNTPEIKQEFASNMPPPINLSELASIPSGNPNDFIAQILENN
jgi:hypothetical protein